MSLMCPIGPEGNILIPGPQQCHRIFLPNPIISLYDLEVLRCNTYRGWKVSEIDFIYFDLLVFFCFYGVFNFYLQTNVIDITFPKTEGKVGFLNALSRICDEACQAAQNNYQLIILSDKKASADR